MSFVLSDADGSTKMFLTRKSDLDSRLDPFYYQPHLVELEAKVQKVTKHRLRDFVTRMAGGATPSTKEAEVHYTEDAAGVPFIRVQNLSTTGELNLKDCKRITRQTHEGLLARSRLTGGELLVKITGVGRMAVASVVPEGFEGNINQHIVAIRTNDIKTSQTLAAYLNLDLSEKLASRRSTGGTRPALDYPALLSIPIIFDERIYPMMRSAITGYKRRVDQAIELLARMDDMLLYELGIPRVAKPEKTDASRMFLQKFSKITGTRFDPLLCDPYHISLRDMVASSGQKHTRLRNCVTQMVSGDWGDDDTEDYDATLLQRCLVIRNTEFDNNFNLQIGGGREKYRLIAKAKLKSLDVEAYDILVEKSGGSIDQPVGRVGIIEPDFINDGPLCFSNFLLKLKVNSSLIDPEFLFVWLKASHRLGITHSMQGQTNGIRNLIVSEYLEQAIPLPPLTRQVEIKELVTNTTLDAKRLLTTADVQLQQAKEEIQFMVLREAKTA